MSYPSPIVLKDAAAANDPFLRISADRNQVYYAREISSLAEPTTLVIGHQMTTAQEGSDRHLVKITKVVADSAGKLRTAVLNVTLSIPRQTVSRADVDQMIANARSFLESSANVDALLRGEL